MVFSASSLRAYATTGSLFGTGLKQAVYVSVGLPVMFLASRLPVRAYRAAAYPLLLITLALLVLVCSSARRSTVAAAGSRCRWGSTSSRQSWPSWRWRCGGADLLVRKQKLIDQRSHLLVPLVPVAGLVLMLILLQPDFGTAVSVGPS
jgi:cell division protein FtsW